MNYYPFHIGDYASATRHLSWDEDMAYRRLLDLCYTTEKPLPVEMRSVFRLVMAQTEGQREAVETVLREFFIETTDGWVNARANSEIDAMREKQQKQREKANKRWHKPEEVSGNATASEVDATAYAAASEINADAMPPTPTPTPLNTSPKGDVTRKRGACQKPEDVCEAVWQDFTKLRKQKRAALTQTALDGLRREAAKAAIPLEDALAYCCEQGWQGFNAGWYAERTTGKTAQSETTYQRTMRERMTEFAPSIARKPPEQRQSAVEFFNAIEVPSRTLEAIK